MGDILLRNIPPAIDHKLRESAARHNRSLSDEAKIWLQRASVSTTSEPMQSLVQSLRSGLDDDDFIDLEIPKTPDRDPPDFS
jgi:plasmid stability protein